MLWNYNIRDNKMSVADRYTGIQTLLKQCGTDGCLFLCLCTIIEEENNKPVDIIDLIRLSLERGWIGKDFTVYDSIGILNHMTTHKWSRGIVPTCPRIGAHEYAIVRYYNPRTGLRHFRRKEYDVLEKSITVKEGSVECYYIYSWS